LTLKGARILLTPGRDSFARAKVVANASWAGDGFSTIHWVEHLNDPDFQVAKSRSFDAVPLHHVNSELSYRFAIVCWAARHALNLPSGDFVECGVHWGLLSKTICEYVSFGETDRTMWLLDTWGLNEGADIEYTEDIYAEVRRRFDQYENVKLVRGLVPETLSQITSEHIAFLSLDMNTGRPEVQTLEYLWPKIVSGGIIYLDDYGWDYPELRREISNWSSLNGISLLVLPTGNALIVKP